MFIVCCLLLPGDFHLVVVSWPEVFLYVVLVLSSFVSVVRCRISHRLTSAVICFFMSLMLKKSKSV